jgi:predicted MPP superfamily phosphohydrolase
LKKSSFVIFLSVVLTIYGLINYYIFMTGWHAVAETHKLLYTAVFLGLSLSYIAGRFLERKFLNWFSSLLVWIGSFWLALMVYFLFASLVVDLVRLINLIVSVYPASFYADYHNTKFIAFAIINIIVFLVVLFGYINARNPRIRKLELTVNKKAGGLKSLKIAAASDIHLGTIICSSRLEKIVKIINGIDADIVLLPGDVVDEDIKPVIKQNLGEVLRRIKSKYGVYAITGNHEYIGGVEPACKYLIEHGIVELRDSYIKIADAFYIIGREDRASKGFAGILRKPLGKIMEGIDKSLPLILMDHQPVHLEEAENHGIDLQLSGHTHHGQLWPFNFITKKIYELSWGYKRRGNTHYYVSCGAGSWGPPIRTGNTPEIIEINLKFSL